MSDLISQLWEGLRDAGLPEVMLYLPDNTASRCHWEDTALVGEIRVALLADQDRGIVRIVPVSTCKGIGIAAPKGTDPSAYRPLIHQKLQALEKPNPDPAALFPNEGGAIRDSCSATIEDETIGGPR